MIISAAEWSAIAATLSAIAAFLLWRTEKQSFLHSARPEIVVAGWNRAPSATPDKVTFNTLENVGNGSALHIYMNIFSIADDDRPMATMSTIRETLISPGSKVSINGEIAIWWNNIAGSPGSKSLPINMEIFCWDTTGIRYLTKYNLLVSEPSSKLVVTNEIASGVILSTRTVKAESVWKLKFKQKLSRTPFIGLFFIEK